MPNRHSTPVTALDVAYYHEGAMLVDSGAKDVFIKYKKIVSAFIKKAKRTRVKDITAGMAYVAMFLLGIAASSVFLAYTAPMSALTALLASVVYNYVVARVINSMLARAEMMHKQGKLSDSALDALRNSVKAYQYGNTAAEIAGVKSAAKLVKTFQRAGVISIIQQKKVLRFLKLIYVGRKKLTDPEMLFKMLHVLSKTGLLDVSKMKRLLGKAYTSAKRVKDLNPSSLRQLISKSRVKG